MSEREQPPPADLPQLPLYESRTREDQTGRVLVPVWVNHRGPFQFLLDTGANRTVLTPRLVAAVGATIAHGPMVTLSGVTGSAWVPTVSLDQVKAGEVMLDRPRLPVADALSTDTDGILGVDSLRNTRVLMDFTRNKVSITRAHREGAMDGLTSIPGQFRFGRLLIVRASVDRIPVKAIIDTGSARTLGNPALLAKLRSRAGKGGPNPKVDVIGQTLARQTGELQRVRLVRMGNFQMLDATIVFGDFYIFKLWRLDAVPALVIGMDMLGTLDQLVIDYRSRELQLRVRSHAHRKSVTEPRPR